MLLLNSIFYPANEVLPPLLTWFIIILYAILIYTRILIIFYFYFLGEWSCWTDFSECSVTCGEGVRKRTRNCMLQGIQAEGCEGPSESLEPCYVPCQNMDMGWEVWSEWSDCDKDSQKHRSRRCTLERCLGPEVESVPCFETNRIGKLWVH